MTKTKEKLAFGDFQTPLELASEVVSTIDINRYKTIIEPTCGLGNFLFVCESKRKMDTRIIGWEINPKYVEKANKSLQSISNCCDSFVKQQDFFDVDWKGFNNQIQDPLLFIGNPPWVTNTKQGKMLSKNLPEKSNFKGLNGLDAMTGKSNFDISEWMLIKIAKIISNKNSAMAFLVKTSVARKVFTYICQHNLYIGNFFIKEIDAKKHFNVNVDACLFFAQGMVKNEKNRTCKVFSSIHAKKPYKHMGIFNDVV